jgi:hypothetical protein
MPLQPDKLPTMTLLELAQELHKREDSDDHLMAKPEILRRQTQAQLDACAAQERSARYMLWCAIAATVTALAAAVAASIVIYFLSTLVVTTE